MDRTRSVWKSPKVMNDPLFRDFLDFAETFTQFLPIKG
jgi:hypothetical protein